MKDKIKSKEKEKEIFEAKVVRKDVSPDSKALIKFGEQQITNSIDTLNKFSQTMLTLDSGLFAVYFAILSFLGIETTTAVMPVSIGYVALPPVLFILSIVAFIMSFVPIYTELSLSFPSDIQKTRSKILSTKYLCIILGVALVVSALAITIDVYVKLLFQGKNENVGDIISDSDSKNPVKNISNASSQQTNLSN